MFQLSFFQKYKKISLLCTDVNFSFQSCRMYSVIQSVEHHWGVYVSMSSDWESAVSVLLAYPVTCFFTYTALNWNALKNANHKTSLETLSIWHVLKPISVFDSVLQQKAGAALFLLTAKQQPSKSAQPAILAGSL